MASLRPWVVAALASCLALALAYVPPRGAKSSGRESVIFFQVPRGTPAREHAQALAAEWRGVEASLRLLSARRQIHDVVRAASDRGNSLVVVNDSGVTFAAPIADSAAHVAWRQLGLGETKVSVALVIRWASLSPPRDRPALDEGIAGYLPPDSTDRTTCLAVVTAGRYWTRNVLSNTRDRFFSFGALVHSLKAGLGPCAFYAAFGTPGVPVHSWLAARNWDLAASLDPGARGRSNSMIEMAEPRYSWYWDAIYSLPPMAVACLAGRPDGCRAAVVAGAGDEPATPFPEIMQVDRRWNRIQRLVEAGRYLGDVARAVGRDRFLAFWTSPQPVDTALATALKRPVGEWTADWQRDFVRPIRLGPAPPLGGVGLALTIAMLAIAIVAGTAARRQVR